eukprot:CCRYP_017952-RC/>CCRYP_017952-RC protein AED:0.05 eAED:0.05 QI:67/1/1/1/0.33/0.25/4/1402/295
MMTGSIQHLRFLAIIGIVLLVHSTAFTRRGTLLNIQHRLGHLHMPRIQTRYASASGKDIRDFRSKTFSPIPTVTSRAIEVDDARYSNNDASHVSTLKIKGQVVEDFRTGSASRHTVDNSVVDHSSAAAASPSPTFYTSFQSIPYTNDASYPGGKHYQLEELEDSETSTTDIFLNTDNTINVGETNGPLFLSAYGAWTTRNTNLPMPTGTRGGTQFEMQLTRKYQTGKEGTHDTDIGEFDYEVKRTFRGEMTLVGGTVLAVNGEILDVDETLGDRRVGFFNMIDTTEARKQDSVDQ